MRNLDFTPLFRATVGFDRLVDLAATLDQAQQSATSYPPYNIKKQGENAYRISIALAGFSADDLTIEQQENSLLIAGKGAADEVDGQYLHRGIATRNFSRCFQLAEHIRVTQANLSNGMLHIDLVREIPEALQPRQIPINTNGKTLNARSTAA